MGMIKRIYAVTDNHTFNMFNKRAKEEGLTLDSALRKLVIEYSHGKIKLAPESKKKPKSQRFDCTKENISNVPKENKSGRT